MSRNTNFLWEINGTKGEIKVTGNIGHGQFAELSIFAAQGDDKELKALEVPKEYYAGRPEGVIPCNVAGIYALVAKDIQTGSREAPSFSDALARITSYNVCYTKLLRNNNSRWLFKTHRCA